MKENDPPRRPDGRFLPGYSYSPGRPPRKYSIASALAEFADEPASIDDEGNVLTRAQAAARWLWQVVLDPNASEKHRFEAFREVRRAIEPDAKQPDQDAEPSDDERRMLAALEQADPADIERLKEATAQLYRGR